jgi:hypothetical protein
VPPLPAASGAHDYHDPNADEEEVVAVHRLHRPARHHDGDPWLSEHLPLRVPPAEGPRRRVGFGYHKQVLPILIVFVVVSALEMLVVDLIMRRWHYIRSG